MWSACHKKRYLLCVELTNFGIFTKPFPIFFSKQAKLRQPHRAETADFRFQISNFEIRQIAFLMTCRPHKREFSPKKFWILKFFGLRQNLTWQLPAQIKKGCSKFWICHTFKYCLNCGTNSIFKKQWADNVLKFFFISHSTHFWRENFGILEKILRQNLYW